MNLGIGTILGPYELLSLLGKGGMLVINTGVELMLSWRRKRADVHL